MKILSAIILAAALSGCFTAGAIDRMTADHAAQIEANIQQESVP